MRQSNNRTRHKLLLHVCCAPCLLGTYWQLQNNYELVLYYFNPNIAPQKEFFKRLSEVKRIAKIKNLELIYDNDYSKHEVWKRLTKKYFLLPEDSERCLICYEYRLRHTAKKSRELGIDFFATTLSLGNRKDADKINSIGMNIAKEFGLHYVVGNWKKNNGWNVSIIESKKYNVYRQQYCGCEFSLRERILQLKKKGYDIKEIRKRLRLNV